MPDARISQLPLAAELDGTELVPVVQGGVTSKTTTQDIASLAAGGGAHQIARGSFDNHGNQIGEWVGIDSVEWSCAEPGRYIVVFTTDYFASAPAVVASVEPSEGPREINTFNPTFSQVEIVIHEGGGRNDAPFTIIAIGTPGPPVPG